MTVNKNFMEDMFKKINDIANEELKKAGIKENQLLKGLRYMNGNDGTDFDWEANDRTCEFFRFYKNKMGAIKLYITKDNKIEGIIWKTDKTIDGEYIEPRPTGLDMFNDEPSKVTGWLQRNLDDKDIIDSSVY